MFMTAAKPSDRQIKYAEDLGIQVRRGISRDELSAQMDTVIGRSFKTGKFVKQVDPSVYDRKPWSMKAAHVINWIVFVCAVLVFFVEVSDPVKAPGAGNIPAMVMGGSMVAGVVIRLVRWIGR